MDECKNRAAGSLEWKEGERERFEKWASNHGLSIELRSNGHYERVATLAAWDAWNARQPEIDALKAENEAFRRQIDTMSATCMILNGRMGDMKAENENLRKALRELYQSDKDLHDAPDEVPKYLYEAMLRTHYDKHAEAGKLLDAAMTAPDTEVRDA